MPSAPALRIQAFDWLRGLAVVFMVQTHSLVLLLPSLREGPFYRNLVWIDGLVAPSFIFSAGFSLALVQVRGAKAGARLSRVRRTLRRLFEVLAVATLVNTAWFPVFREPKWLLRIDILHCIGLSLLIALPLLALLATRPRVLRWVALALALVCFALAPLAETWTGPWAPLVNNNTGSLFPLLPWAGYVYLGASAGAAGALGDARVLARWLLFLLALGAALWGLEPWLSAAYPQHNFWQTNPSNHGHRWTQVTVLLLSFFAFEVRAPPAWHKARLFRFLAVFGGSSLAAYFFHEMLLYYGRFSVASFFRDSVGWPAFGGLVGLVVAATFALTFVTDKVYRWVDARLPSWGASSVQTPPASTGHTSPP